MSSSTADIIVQVLCYGSNDSTGRDDLPLFRRDQTLIGFLRPLGSMFDTLRRNRRHRGHVVFRRIDAAHYPRPEHGRALFHGHHLRLQGRACSPPIRLPRMFPMLTTAAGTITPARVFVIGAGVAGLQAIATARRLGAVASAYDLRPAVEGAGAEPGRQLRRIAHRSERRPGRARLCQGAGRIVLSEQRELLGRVVGESDVVITAAVVPGKKSPVLVTEEMVDGMAPGSVIVDLGRRARRQLRIDQCPARPLSSTA